MSTNGTDRAIVPLVRLTGPAACAAMREKSGIRVSTAPPVVDVPATDAQRFRIIGRRFARSGGKALRPNGRYIPDDKDRAVGLATIHDGVESKRVRLRDWLRGIKAAKIPIPTLDACNHYLRLVTTTERGARRGGLDYGQVHEVIWEFWPGAVFVRGRTPYVPGDQTTNPPEHAVDVKVTKVVPVDSRDDYANAALHAFEQLDAKIERVDGLLRRVLSVLGYEEKSQA